MNLAQQAFQDPIKLSPDQKSKVIFLANQAGGLIQLLKASGLTVQRKEDGSVVTNADMESQALVVRGLQKAFPAPQIVGEEQPISYGKTKLPVWYVDPVDGTKALVEGKNFYAVFIGRRVEDALDFGVMYYPERKELYVGGVDHPATLNGVKLTPSMTPDIRPGGIGVVSKEAVRLPDDLKSQTKFDSRNLALLAVCDGTLDAAIIGFHKPVKLWDLAASYAIAESVGVQILDRGAGLRKYAIEDNQVPAGSYLCCRPEKLPVLRAVLGVEPLL